MAGKGLGKKSGRGAQAKGSGAIRSARGGKAGLGAPKWSGPGGECAQGCLTAHALLASRGISREAALAMVQGRLVPDFAEIQGSADAEVVLLRKPSAERQASKPCPAKESRLPGKCRKCGKDAAITLAYAHTEYCQPHFVKFFESRVKRCVRQFSMLKKGEKVAVALSGGKDSCVVLSMLHKIRQSLPFDMVAITIDAGIGGQYANTLAAAKSECRRLGVEHHVVSMEGELGKSLPGLSGGGERACSYCGVARRYLLNKWAKRLGAERIAVGHNADDVAQTVLMNFMRNEPGRLARFAPVTSSTGGEFVPRIKPLFTTPERDVAAYALMKGMPIGFEECPYARGAFRQDMREMLHAMEEKYPSTKLRIVRAFLSGLGGAGMGNGRKTGGGMDGGKGKIRIPSCPSCGEPSSREGEDCAMCRMLKE